MLQKFFEKSLFQKIYKNCKNKNFLFHSSVVMCSTLTLKGRGFDSPIEITFLPLLKSIFFQTIFAV